MKPLLLCVLVGFTFAACGGKVTISDDSDAATDAAIDTKTEPTDAAPTSTPTTTVTPPSCPAYRPISEIPCSMGLSCFYPCAPGFDTSIRATCPSGRWKLEVVAACD